MASIKQCLRCGKDYKRPLKLSITQWEKRRFCSRRCGAMKRSVGEALIASLYLSGESSIDIGKRFNLSGTHVLRILRASGVEVRPHSENKKLSHAKPEVKEKLSKAAKGRRLPESAKRRLREIYGPNHHAWRAGITITHGGYIGFTPSKANGCNAGKLLHQIIAEWKIKRPLEKGEHVHHKDGNKLNNHPDNITVMKASDHNRLHAIQSGLGKRKKQAC